MAKQKEAGYTPQAVPNPEVTRYLEALAGERKSSLSRLRALILETVPAATESMQYRMLYPVQERERPFRGGGPQAAA